MYATAVLPFLRYLAQPTTGLLSQVRGSRIHIACSPSSGSRAIVCSRGNNRAMPALLMARMMTARRAVCPGASIDTGLSKSR